MGNIANIAKINSIKRVSTTDEKSIANILAQKGYNRQPGAVIRLVPYKEADERYRTGLDENAAYIEKFPKEQQDIEREKVRTLRTKLEAATKLNLDSRSEYYSGTYGSKYGTRGVAESVKLKDGETVFNLDDPYQAITFAWLSVHPMIAMSYEHYRTGKAGPSVQYYVSNPEVEDKITYTENIGIDRAIAELVNMSPDRRKVVGKLLALPVADNDTEQQVYNQLTKFLKSGEIKQGENKGFRAVALFNNVVGLKEEVMAIKALIRDALTTGVYRKIQRAIYEGEGTIADDEDMLLRRLASTKGQVEYLALEKKVQDKRLIAR